MIHASPTPDHRARRAGTALARILILLPIVVATAPPASGLLLIDFEQPYYVHPDWQIWDFSLVESNGLYVLFYGAVPMSDPYPSASDHIWRTTSTDLIHWSPPVQVLGVSSAAWETRAVWAPDVVFDDASGYWWMAYTGVDELRNQRLCMAYSANLTSWSKSPGNPIQEPAPPTFLYYPDSGWSECRDPFLYHRDGAWRVLSTVRTTDLPAGQGALARATATTMHSWSDPEVFVLNAGVTPEASLESSQYVLRNGIHHLFFHEYGTAGITHLAATDEGAWDFADRVTIDLGIAPEIDSYDGGASWLVSRVAPYHEPHLDALNYVVRIDTLTFSEGTQSPTVTRSPPLAREFAVYVGNIVLGNPCFGDNPLRRGEPAVGLVGNCYFGSREYFQGPLSGRGSAGQELTDTATGHLDSHPFVIAGNSISLRVGGTGELESCYVALMDAQADTILLRETGEGQATMTERWWDVTPYQGWEAYIRIVDQALDGHICVDHIKESMILVDAGAPAAAPAAALVDRGAWPNPCNPRTELRFDVARATTCRVAIYDLRGRLVWRSAAIAATPGSNAVAWRGRDGRGAAAPGGVYVYRITSAEGHAVAGKLTLIP